MCEETDIVSDLKLRFLFWTHKIISNIIDVRRTLIIAMLIYIIIMLYIFEIEIYHIIIFICLVFLLKKATNFWVKNIGTLLQVVNFPKKTLLNMRPVRVNLNYTKEEILKLEKMTLDSFKELYNNELLKKMSSDYFDFTTSKIILKRLIKEVSRINGLSFDKEIFEIKSKEGGNLLINGEKVFLENKGKKINTMECNNLNWFAPISLIRKRILENKDYVISVRLPVSLLKSTSSS